MRDRKKPLDGRKPPAGEVGADARGPSRRGQKPGAADHGPGFLLPGARAAPWDGGTLQGSVRAEDLRRTVLQADRYDLREDRKLGPGHLSPRKAQAAGKDGKNRALNKLRERMENQ